MFGGSTDTPAGSGLDWKLKSQLKAIQDVSKGLESLRFYGFLPESLRAEHDRMLAAMEREFAETLAEHSCGDAARLEKMLKDLPTEVRAHVNEAITRAGLRGLGSGMKLLAAEVRELSGSLRQPGDQPERPLASTMDPVLLEAVVYVTEHADLSVRGHQEQVIDDVFVAIGHSEPCANRKNLPTRERIRVEVYRNRKRIKEGKSYFFLDHPYRFITALNEQVVE